ncbi:MAG: exo-alpha-sialidase [Candidatus Latescibacteria bacterium]|nr:exo-alpha-sialidase [Candidatus Latescibacterota bacterium]
MKITSIEPRRVTLRYVTRGAYELSHYHDMTQRTVYVVRTDTGLVGLGESERTESQEVMDRYLGTNPFQWLGDETSLGLGTAMYDLMGKAAGVPVYQLFGQKHRSWVPVAAWTVSTHPERMAAAVADYAEQGYTWMKFHLSPFENVIDQTEAMQRVAPEGFRLHYDFTMHGTDDHMPSLLDRLAEYPIAGCFEDPLPGEDLDGYIELKVRAKRPIVLHHFPTAATYEVMRRPADAYMLGHMRIGDAQRRAGLFAAAGAPFMLQNSGSDITRAMTTHMMAAFPTGSFHTVTATEILRDRFVTEPLNPVNGFLRVSEAPGLGVELDEEKMAEFEQEETSPSARFLLETRYANGAHLRTRKDPNNPHFMVRPDWSRELPPPSFAAPLSTRYWDDDETDAFSEAYTEVAKEGSRLTFAEPDGGDRAQVLSTHVICRQPGRYIGWPTIVRRANDELVVAFSGDRDSHVCPFGKMQLVRSQDGGKSWSKERTILNGPLDDRDSGLIETTKGTLLASWFTSILFTTDDDYTEHAATVSDQTREKESGHWVHRSTDGGDTWGEKIAVCSSAPHGPIQLADGRLLYVGNGTLDGEPVVVAEESADDGQTWSVISRILVDETIESGIGEPHLVECASGRLVAMFRTRWPSIERRLLFQSESEDGGHTWTPARPTTIFGYPPHLKRLADDRLLLTYGKRIVPQGEFARVSRDEGRTWGEELLLSPDYSLDLGYPASTQLADGTIYTVFYGILPGDEKTSLQGINWRLR